MSGTGGAHSPSGTMHSPTNNIALIGMPGAGKSTLGVLLAKRSARAYVDTDLLIQSFEDASLREILASRGVEAFRKAETRIVLGLECSNTVIATGGSVVYGAAAMEHLGRIGRRVFLDVPIEQLAGRLGDLDKRGVIRHPHQDLADLLEERLPLYERWADVRIQCGDLHHDGVFEAILEALSNG
jgi:shikimate kinase